MDIATVYKNDTHGTEIRRTGCPDYPYTAIVAVDGVPYRVERYRWLASATEAIQQYEKTKIIVDRN